MATLVDQDHDQKQTDLVETDKAAATTGSEHFELTQVDSVGNYVYADDDVEPALTWRTYVAFISLCIYQAAATTVVTATPSVVSGIQKSVSEHTNPCIAILYCGRSKWHRCPSMDS